MRPFMPDCSHLLSAVSGTTFFSLGQALVIVGSNPTRPTTICTHATWNFALHYVHMSVPVQKTELQDRQNRHLNAITQFVEG
jgi:hypothetical protein